jgi:hypothetical protein
VIPDDAAAGRAFRPFRAGKVRRERKLQALHARLEAPGQRRELKRHQPFHLRRDRLAMLPRQGPPGVRAAPRIRIGVRAAADRDERRGPGKFPLDRLLRVTRPVAADLVELAAQRRAMTRVVGDERAQGAVGIFDLEQRQRRISGPGGGTPVAGEAGAALRPG